MGHVQAIRVIPASPNEVFDFLADLQNLPEQLGGMIETEFTSTPPALKTAAEFEVSMRRFQVTAKITARVDEFLRPHRLAYRQMSGVFKTWSHVMILDEHAPGQTRLTDIVDFTMPFGLLGQLADDLIVKEDVSRLLEYRLNKIFDHFARQNHVEL